MARRMWPIDVDIDDRGFIRISQELGALSDDAFVLLHPDQADLLIQWINDARDELQRQ